MISRRFRQLFLSYYNKKRCEWLVSDNMAAHRFRVIVNAAKMWSRSYFVGSVFRHCSRDRAVREVLHYFRQAFRPRRTLLLSATAAYKSAENEDPPPCEQSISDEELEQLMSELEAVEELSKRTLYCAECGKRLVIDRKHSGIHYCTCKTSTITEGSDILDGWEPYMEAEDVVIWQREQRSGQGLYAYKVYGRYNEVWARDFAAIQVDGDYRKSWDSAVGSISVVEEGANGVGEQAVVHWEVLWPRMFANRDYVYIRRHKEFDVINRTRKEPIFSSKQPEDSDVNDSCQRPNVHSRARRKSLQNEQRRAKVNETEMVKNKTFIIVSRSCEHSKVPETRNVVRVTEYWSHMCVRSLRGPEEPGMEFVLTYYDEPGAGSVGAMAAWATGRAAPAYLERMRRAAHQYGGWRQMQVAKDCKIATEKEGKQEVHTEDSDQTQMVHPEKITEVSTGMPVAKALTKDEKDVTKENCEGEVSHTEDELSQRKDEVSHKPGALLQKSDQTSHEPKEDLKKESDTNDKSTQTDVPQSTTNDVNTPTTPEEESETQPESNGGWWKYLYPFYYFL